MKFNGIMSGTAGFATLAMINAQIALGAGNGDCTDPSKGGILNGANCAAPTGATNNLFANGGLFNKLSNTLIFIVGAVAVIMLIVGGLQYVLSAGNEKSVGTAKNTILYAIIGIIVAVIAYAIVNFVIVSIVGK